jgi:hypothetical protein
MKKQILPEEAVEAAAKAWVGEHAWQDSEDSHRADYMRNARELLEAAAPYIIAPALALAEDWDAVAEVFPKSAAGVFAKSHANRLREALGEHEEGS